MFRPGDIVVSQIEVEGYDSTCFVVELTHTTKNYTHFYFSFDSDGVGCYGALDTHRHATEDEKSKFLKEIYYKTLTARGGEGLAAMYDIREK